MDRSLCQLSVSSRLSYTSELKSLSYSDYNSIDGFDLAKDHGRQSGPIEGRESHTSDLDEFERYFQLMVDDKNNTNSKLGDHHDHHCSHIDESENDNCINEKFWSHVRTLLKKAAPVGYSELPDSNEVIHKGPDDVTEFFMKVIGISDINPIHPVTIAKNSGVPVSEVLNELFYATRVGLVHMLWTPECTRCGGAACTEESLMDIPESTNCDTCSHLNTINSLEKIKVVFLLNNSVLHISADNFACTPSAKSMSFNAVFTHVPATATGSGFRYSAGCGGKKQLRETLPKGRYRMHCPVAMTDSYLVVENDAKPENKPLKLNLPVSELVCNGPESMCPRKTITVPHGRIHFDVHPDTGSFFVLWIQHNQEDEELLMFLPENERPPYTPAAEVINHPTFNKLFPKQIVPSREVTSLSIRNVVLVFTDIVGSTALYAANGDGKALQLVRRHFKVIFSAFTRHGRVVKTIGDAVMAAFPSGAAAIEAAAAALSKVPKFCSKPDGQPLQIRIGIHAGSALVVPLNGISDYFGQTVNISARVEAAAKASEALITEDILKDPASLAAYGEVVKRSRTFLQMPLVELNLKGVEKSVFARGFRVRKMAKFSDSFKMIVDDEPVEVDTPFSEETKKYERPLHKSHRCDRKTLLPEGTIRSISMDDITRLLHTKKNKQFVPPLALKRRNSLLAKRLDNHVIVDGNEDNDSFCDKQI